MNLREAKLCLNCDEVFSGTRCPACAALQPGFPIERWLNRDRESPEWIDAVIESLNQEREKA